jgi:hypothetical protein
MSNKTLVKKCTYVFGVNDIVKNKVISYIGCTTSMPTNIHLTRVEDHNALDIAPEHPPPRCPHGVPNSHMVKNTNTIIEDKALNNLLLPREK